MLRKLRGVAIAVGMVVTAIGLYLGLPLAFIYLAIKVVMYAIGYAP